MLTHDDADIAHLKRTVPVGSDLPPSRKQRLPENSGRQSEGSRTLEKSKQSNTAHRLSETKPVNDAEVLGSRWSSFGLEEIRTITFRCHRCRTVVRFPRIRWTSFPESCPNCRTQWMTPPTAQGSWQEDTSTYVFRVVLAFREALQALVSMESTVVFRLALEMGDYPNDGNTTAATKGQNGNSRG